MCQQLIVQKRITKFQADKRSISVTPLQSEGYPEANSNLDYRLFIK